MEVQHESSALIERVDRIKASVSRRFQTIVDRTVPWLFARWTSVGVVLLLFLVRVWIVQGYYIVTYALGIYLLSLLVGFLSPLEDPEADAPAELPITTSKNDDEFKPFVRKLPEFKFWYKMTKAIVIAFVCSLIPVFDIPVFWPILVIYFVALVFVQVKARIAHMRKFGYVPFSFGKPTFVSRTGAPAAQPAKLQRD